MGHLDTSKCHAKRHNAQKTTIQSGKLRRASLPLANSTAQVECGQGKAKKRRATVNCAPMWAEFRD